MREQQRTAFSASSAAFFFCLSTYGSIISWKQRKINTQRDTIQLILGHSERAHGSMDFAKRTNAVELGYHHSTHHGGANFTHAQMRQN